MGTTKIFEVKQPFGPLRKYYLTKLGQRTIVAILLKGLAPVTP